MFVSHYSGPFLGPARQTPFPNVYISTRCSPFSLLANFYNKLSSTKAESGGTLMDETVTVATGNNSVSQRMGPHNGNEIPVLVAGGRFTNHGGHVIRKGETTCDIYLSILKKFGIQRDQFGNSRKIIQL